MSSNLSSFFGQWCVNINLKFPAMKFYSVILKETVKVMSSAIVYLGLLGWKKQFSKNDKNICNLHPFLKYYHPILWIFTIPPLWLVCSVFSNETSMKPSCLKCIATKQAEETLKISTGLCGISKTSSLHFSWDGKETRRELITSKLHAWQTIAELRPFGEMRRMNSSVGCQSFAPFLSSSINNDLFFPCITTSANEQS